MKSNGMVILDEGWGERAFIASPMRISREEGFITICIYHLPNFDNSAPRVARSIRKDSGANRLDSRNIIDQLVFLGK